MNKFSTSIIISIIAIMIMTPLNLWGGKKKISSTPDFDYPQTVSKTALADLKTALRTQDGSKMVDALVRYSLAQSSISQENMTDIVSHIDKVIAQEKRPDITALLYYLEARIFAEYGNQYAHFVPSNKEDKELPKDYTEWTLEQFSNKIDQLTSKALAHAQALQACPLSNYSSIIKYDKMGLLYEPTLFEFLSHSILEHALTKSKENVLKAWIDYEKKQGNVPAYLNACQENQGTNYLELYRQYQHNEHSAIMLLHLNAEKHYALYKQYLATFPNNFYTPQVKNEIIKAEEKNVIVNYQQNLLSNEALQVDVTSKNVNHVSLQLYQVPDAVIAKTKNSWDHVAISGLKLIETKRIDFAGQVPFQNQGKTTFGPLPYGRYVVMGTFENEGKIVKRTKTTLDATTTVCDIATFYVENQQQATQFFAVDAKTGSPLEGVKFKGKGLDAISGSDGSVTMPRSNYYQKEFKVSKGNDKYAPAQNYYQSHRTTNMTIERADIFTDLGIYRPGETVKFALIAYQSTQTKRSVIANEKVEVTFADSNNKDVETLTLTTDQFGRVEGSFKIPTDRLNGSWRIRARGRNITLGSQDVNVSEYKTPTFAVEFPQATYCYTKGQPVSITGQAKTYSGMPVAGAQVKLSLKSHEWTWWWRWETGNSGDHMLDTTAVTDNEGKFTLTLPCALFDEDLSDISWWKSYALNALVTLDAGETQEACHNFVIGKRRSLKFNDDAITLQLNRQPTKLPVEFNSTDDNEKSATCTYMITDSNKKLVKTGTFVSDKPQVDLGDLPSGQYTIEAQIAGDTTTKAQATLIAYRTTDKKAPIDDTAMWIPDKGKQVDNKNVAHVLIGTSSPESHIYYVACSRNRELSRGWLKYGPGMHDFKIQIPNEPDEYVTLNFYNVYKGKVSQKECMLTSTLYAQKLKVRVTSFRDKLVPGVKEKWQFTLLDQDNKPVQAAMMLEMFDKALHELSPNDWKFNPQYNYSDVATLLHSLWPYRNYFNNNSVSWQQRLLNSNSYTLPYLNLYDQDFFTGNLMETAIYGYRSKSLAKVEMTASAVEENSIADKTKFFDESSSLQEVVVVTSNKQENQSRQANLDKVKMRLSDVKTALWQPMLVSDDKGNIGIEFEAPEFNTTWVMQAIGYTTQLTTDKIEKEVLTQKPIMVKSSLPRFLRQGDIATLAASVQNATEQPTRCDAVIELFDPRTGKVYASRNFNENLTAMGTNAVNIEWSVPDTIAFVGFRIKAANDNFGDGEQVMIPVLPAISPVVETLPFFIDAASTQFTTRLPQFKGDSRVTLEYCNNPVWYCVTALPTLFDNNYRITTSLAHNLFAEVLAQGVAKSQPQIRQAIAHWKQNASDSTLVSMLEKNQDLKIGTLLASPWLQEADRQTLRMSKLDELFDEAKMATEHNKIVEGLQSLQLADGGWCWYRYPRCQSSLYTTEIVLQIIGRLHHLGYLKDDARINAMVQRAMGYYDTQYLNLFNEQIKHNKNNYTGFGSYVYTRSMFKEINLSKANKAMIDKCLKAMTKDWKGLSLGEKAYYAMTLHRNGYKPVAKDIVESIRQFSITKPELGMYWDNVQVGWRYFDKVAVTSTILQAMNEIEPRTAEIDQVRKWILLMKQSNDWGSSSLAADAVYTILSLGSQWLDESEAPTITIDGKPVGFDKMARYLGYCRKSLPASSLATLHIEHKGQSPAWGAIYSQFKAPMTSIKEHAIAEMSIGKEYFIYQADGSIKPATQFKVGDKVQVRTIIKNNKDLDFVTVTDERGACFEPVKQLSGYERADDTWYYLETKDSNTNIFFDNLQKGTHIISYDVYVTSSGTFSAGIATTQCQYAPQISAHSAGNTLTVAPK